MGCDQSRNKEFENFKNDYTTIKYPNEKNFSELIKKFIEGFPKLEEAYEKVQQNSMYLLKKKLMIQKTNI